MLIALAQTIHAHLRPFDGFGRLGGDESVVLLPSAPAGETAAVCERILNAVRNLPPIGGESEPATDSIGYTEAQPNQRAADLIARADRALYCAKVEGRDRACGEAV